MEMVGKKVLASMTVVASLGMAAELTAMAESVPDVKSNVDVKMGSSMLGSHTMGPLGFALKDVKLTGDQQAKVHQLVQDYHGRVVNQMSEAMQVQSQIADALFAEGKVTENDLKSLLDKAANIQRHVQEEQIKTALAIRDLLTPEQLKQAKATYTRIKDMQEQMRAMQKEMFKKQ